MKLIPVKLCFLLHCVLLVFGALEQTKIDEIVNRHNFFRERVQPPATDMRKISWDPELAYLAETFSKKCNFGHSSKEFRTTERFGSNIGENVLKSGEFSLGELYFEGIKLWHGESAYYKFETGGECTKSPCGHYTQLVWASTYKVGCGATYCSEHNGYVMVCEYYPAGNEAVNGKVQLPYKDGTNGCSQCENTSDVCSGERNNLCSNSERDKVFVWNNPSTNKTSITNKTGEGNGSSRVVPFIETITIVTFALVLKFW